MKIDEVMDEIAGRVRAIPSLSGRTWEWPPGDITPPACIVAYPGPGTYDLSYQRGADRVQGSLLVLLGRPTDKSTRDALTGYVDGSGSESIKVAVDGDDDIYTTCDSVTVTGWDTDVVSVGAGDYLAAVFTLDIVGRGGQ